MAIDLSSVIRVKNNLKRELLSDYVTLRFIGVDNAAINKARAYIGSIVDGWSYKQRRHPERGTVEEILNISSSTQVDEWVESAVGFELLKPNGSFLRFKVGEGGKLKPSAPKYEWEIVISPNSQDTVDI